MGVVDPLAVVLTDRVDVATVAGREDLDAVADPRADLPDQLEGSPRRLLPHHVRQHELGAGVDRDVDVMAAHLGVELFL